TRLFPASLLLRRRLLLAPPRRLRRLLLLAPALLLRRRLLALLIPLQVTALPLLLRRRRRLPGCRRRGATARGARWIVPETTVLIRTQRPPLRRTITRRTDFGPGLADIGLGAGIPIADILRTHLD